jgi:hypothetical protein
MMGMPNLSDPIAKDMSLLAELDERVPGRFAINMALLTELGRALWGVKGPG